MDNDDSLLNIKQESLTDLPSIMRDKIDFDEEFDFLESNTPPGLKDCWTKESSQGQDIFLNFYDNQLLNSNGPSEESHPAKIKRFINLENIAEEESCELDNSRLTEKRKTHNEFDRQNYDTKTNNRILYECQENILENISLVKSTGFFGNMNLPEYLVEKKGVVSDVFKDITGKKVNSIVFQNGQQASSAKKTPMQSFLGAEKSDKTKFEKNETAKKPTTDNSRNVNLKKRSSKSDQNHAFQKSTTLPSKKELKRPSSSHKNMNIQIYQNNNIIINIANGKQSKSFMTNPVFKPSKQQVDAKTLVIPQNAFLKKSTPQKNNGFKQTNQLKKPSSVANSMPNENTKLEKKIPRKKVEKLLESLEMNISDKFDNQSKKETVIMSPPQTQQAKKKQKREISAFSTSGSRILQSEKIQSSEIKTISRNVEVDLVETQNLQKEFQTASRNKLVPEYYVYYDGQNEKNDKVIKEEKPMINKRFSQGHEKLKMNASKDGFLAKLLENTTDEFRKDKLLEEIKKKKKNLQISNELDKKALQSQTVSQFEISTDSLQFTPSQDVRSTILTSGTEANFAQTSEESHHFDNQFVNQQKFSKTSSSMNNFYSKYSTPVTKADSKHSNKYSFNEKFNYDNNSNEITKSGFDKSMLYNMKSDKRQYPEIDLYNAKDFRQGYERKFFNTGNFELKKSIQPKEEGTYNDLKFVMSDVIKTDFIDRSIVSDKFGSSGKHLSKDRGVKIGLNHNKFKEAELAARFSKTSSTIIMTNPDLQNMLALNSKIFNKAKQLIKF